MDRSTLNRFAYLASLIPLPSLILLMIVVAVNSSLGSNVLGTISKVLIWVTILAYATSIVLAVISGIVAKSRWILFPPIAAMLDIVLFLIYLPKQESAVGWRAIDVVLLGGLVVLNILQIVILKKHNTSEQSSKFDLN